MGAPVCGGALFLGRSSFIHSLDAVIVNRRTMAVIGVQTLRALSL
jgi:hypothetical protein